MRIEWSYICTELNPLHPKRLCALQSLAANSPVVLMNGENEKNIQQQPQQCQDVDTF